jgi:uncharacterized protein YndB with AHSA1/START domain
MDRGTFVDHGGRPSVRFQRTYNHPIERVWAAVVNPAELAHWFPSKVELEPRVDGRISFSGDPNTEPSTGRVISFDPPRYLAFTWGGEELHFELEEVGSGQCRFTLTDVLEARDAAARNAAGWSVCLGEFSKHLDGELADGPHSETAGPWRALYDGYVASGMPSGAFIPEVPSAAKD